MSSSASVHEDDSSHPLSHQPQCIVRGVVVDTAINQRRIPCVQRKVPSSLGKLDKLPLELLYECMEALDPGSLSSLSRVSVRGSMVVESLSSLSNITRVSPKLLPLLAQARILRLHSLATLNSALHSDRCVSCGGYGPFLLLLSAERCCFPCLIINPSLWMISIPQARACFYLSARHLSTLPIIWSIPGRYEVPNRHTWPQSIRLTSVNRVKELALRVHGSMENLQREHPLDDENVPPRKRSLWTWYRDAPLRPILQDSLDISNGRVRPDDPFSGMGAFHFPSLRTGRVEQGQWCRVCTHKYNLETLSVIGALVPEGYDARKYLQRMSYHAWSKEEFVQHVEDYHPRSGDLLEDGTEVQ